MRSPNLFAGVDILQKKAQKCPEGLKFCPNIISQTFGPEYVELKINTGIDELWLNGGSCGFKYEKYRTNFCLETKGQEISEAFFLGFINSSQEPNENFVRISVLASTIGK